MNDKIYEQTVENLKIKELSIKITFSINVSSETNNTNKNEDNEKDKNNNLKSIKKSKNEEQEIEEYEKKKDFEVINYNLFYIFVLFHSKIYFHLKQNYLQFFYFLYNSSNWKMKSIMIIIKI